MPRDMTKTKPTDIADDLLRQVRAAARGRLSVMDQLRESILSRRITRRDGG